MHTPVTAKAITIRYKSGAELLYDSHQRDAVIEYLTTCCGRQQGNVVVVNRADLEAGGGAIKTLITLCLTKPEYSSTILDS